MRTLRTVALAALLLAAPAAVGAGDRKPGLGKVIAGKLLARKAAPAPALHTTEAAGDRLGCVNLTRREMRRFGYPGHAFACEEFETGEVLGGVLSRNGFVLCDVVGRYVGGGCYDLDICGVPDALCAY